MKEGSNLSLAVDSLGDVDEGRWMVAGLQCGDDRIWELVSFNGQRFRNLSLSTDRGSGAWEEATGRIAACNRGADTRWSGDDKTMVCASKQELASLDEKNELLMS